MFSAREMGDGRTGTCSVVTRDSACVGGDYGNEVLHRLYGVFDVDFRPLF